MKKNFSNIGLSHILYFTNSKKRIDNSSNKNNSTFSAYALATNFKHELVFGINNIFPLFNNHGIIHNPSVKNKP